MLKVACIGKKVCGLANFYRADGRCICPICGKEYILHPFCVNSSDPSQPPQDLFRDYSMNVLCNGDHVHL